MSNILLLGLQQAIASVQPSEDFAPPTLLFFEADGVTPISLDGIAFTAKIGSVATLTAVAGLTVSGNALTFFVPVNGWPTGKHDFTLLASDGTDTRDIFANSTLTVGQPASFQVTPYGGASSGQMVAALSGATLLALISSLTESQLSSLTQAIFAGLLQQTGSAAPVPTGQAFVDSSNFVVVAD